MIKLHKRKKDISTETMINTVWVSTFLALLLSIPPLGIFLGIYFSTGNIIVGAVLGFGVHFIILLFSEKISRGLVKITS
jgi:hypothetical protein